MLSYMRRRVKMIMNMNMNRFRQCSNHNNFQNNNTVTVNKLKYAYGIWTVSVGVSGSIFGFVEWFDNLNVTSNSYIFQTMILPIHIGIGFCLGIMVGITSPLIIFTYSMAKIKDNYFSKK